MEKKSEIDLVKPEDKRVRTTLNLRKTDMKELSKIAKDQNITLTTMMDKALTIAFSFYKNMSDIDRMLRETNGYIFNRDLERVKSCLSALIEKGMTPTQKAYLYCNLKDTADRQRVFDALSLNEALQQIEAMNGILDKAARFNGEQFVGFNLYTIANELRAPMTILQLEYLTLKLGNEAIVKLQERIPEKFPDLDVGNGSDKKAALDNASMNPALERVLEVIALSKAAWKALPEALKEQIHEAVRVGKTELAKKLASQIGLESETVDLFPNEQELAQ